VRGSPQLFQTTLSTAWEYTPRYIPQYVIIVLFHVVTGMTLIYSPNKELCYRKQFASQRQCSNATHLQLYEKSNHILKGLQQVNDLKVRNGVIR